MINPKDVMALSLEVDKVIAGKPGVLILMALSATVVEILTSMEMDLNPEVAGAGRQLRDQLASAVAAVGRGGKIPAPVKPW